MKSQILFRLFRVPCNFGEARVSENICPAKIKKTAVFLLLIMWNQLFCVYLRSNTEHLMANIGKNEALNRLRVVLAEQEKTNRWLAEQLGKTEHTISRWCHNKSQPSVAQLNEIANVLDVDVRSLITPNMQ